MSGYDEKAQDSHEAQDSYVYNYASTRSSQPEGYAGFTQPSFGPQYPGPHALLGPFEPRDVAYPPSAIQPFMDGGGRIPLEITTLGPWNGIAGDTFRLDLRSRSSPTAQRVTFSFIFGSLSVKAKLTESSRSDSLHHFTISAKIPPAQQAQMTVPLYLEIQDENGHSLEMKQMNYFTYLQADYAPSPKRSAIQPMQSTRYRDAADIYQTGPGAGSGGSGYLSNSNLYALPTAHDRPSQHQRSFGQPLARKPTYHYPSSQGQQATGSSSLVGLYDYSTISRTNPSPRLTAPRTLLTPQHSQPQEGGANPPLIRTSILQPSAQVSSSTSAVPTANAFNPYILYPNLKATLIIQGDLSSMSENWTEDETKAHRRLVEFQRSQSGSTITTVFKAVTPEERVQNSPCISCIWWEARRECYVTSVDTISLLESLVAVRFTVEEKNRIRRNLEGFKPLTVSKSKEDTVDFFKIIMGFPAPRPRNIEKDVKVFAWSVLPSALKKIISKYQSASYTSTSSLLVPNMATPIPTTYEDSSQAPVTTHEVLPPSNSGPQRPTASPHSTASSVVSVSGGYQTSMTSSALSPKIAGSTGLEVTASAGHGHHGAMGLGQMISASGHGHGHQGMGGGGQWSAQYASAQVPQFAAAALPGGNPGRHPSWDMGLASGFLEHSPGNATVTGANVGSRSDATGGYPPSSQQTKRS
ncbi:hypothetical protein EJ06DRAFT_368925 [Trichodelitschia bisporula]|uniref:DUF7082 domain-containing protein n=1 Tax=Trichodelitschia bisporula TaxID=703511 RepID=A0A6G1I1E2_9PEZI|nr:hypothetical protein EJ06DRAFT_368925 [Trichodelitschia bisporula]